MGEVPGLVDDLLGVVFHPFNSSSFPFN
jgi:hypothetical protein